MDSKASLSSSLAELSAEEMEGKRGKYAMTMPFNICNMRGEVFARNLYVVNDSYSAYDDLNAGSKMLCGRIQMSSLGGCSWRSCSHSRCNNVGVSCLLLARFSRFPQETTTCEILFFLGSMHTGDFTQGISFLEWSVKKLSIIHRQATGKNIVFLPENHRMKMFFLPLHAP